MLEFVLGSFQQIQEEAGEASMAVDLDGDGEADVMVTGVDADGDGVPDFLQVNIITTFCRWYHRVVIATPLLVHPTATRAQHCSHTSLRMLTTQYCSPQQ